MPSRHSFRWFWLALTAAALAFLIVAQTAKSQDPDKPIDMDGIDTLKDLDNYSNRRLMDTLRDLRARKQTDYSGDCASQDYLKAKIKLVKAKLRQNGVPVKDEPSDDIGTADCPPKRKASVETKSGNGLQTVTFATQEGRVVVHLPDDIRAGDTISGTVFTEPKGDTAEEKAKNQNILNSTVLDLAGTKIQAERPTFTWTPVIPQPPQPVRYQLKIVEVLGRPTPSAMTQSVADINLDPKTNQPGAGTTPDLKITPSFIIPSLGQTGRPIVITGPFDGNSSNTTLNGSGLRSNVQDFEKNTENVSGGFGLLAESPRKAVFRVPLNVTGPIEMNLKEGNVETKSTYRNVGVNLSAPKTDLLKGEQTTLRVEVNGLEGIKSPVPLTLTYQGVITMEGGPYQPLMIQPSQVGADGRYSTTRKITGVQAGGWGATATVVTSPFDTCLQDDSVPSRVVLWNTFTGDYSFGCPGCLPPKGQRGGTAGPAGTAEGSGGTKTGETTQTGGTTTTVTPNPPPGGNVGPPILTGTGTMARKGCIITLTHNAPDRRVFARLDACTSSASSTVETPPTKMKFSITDENISDNTCSSK